MPAFPRPIRLLAVVSVTLAVVAPASASGAFDPAPMPTPSTERSMPSAPSAAAIAAVLRPLAAAAPAADTAFSPSAAALAARAAAERASARNAPTGHGETRSSSPRSAAKHRTAEHRTVSRTSAPVRYRGTNHVWIPSLGIDRSIAWFPCSRSTPPGLAVYRWGCAGANNVYLFAHAYAAFKPLHDAYVSGRLRKGQQVVYADGAGRVHTYAIAWWRLTTPDHGAFAYAAQSRPSLTLQTCVGARSQYRLIVRLLEVA